MKNNYDIKVNPPKLSSEDISKHKNFDAILQRISVEQPQKQRTAIRRYIGFGTLAIAASLALIFIVRGLNGNDTAAELMALKRPFAGINLNFENFELDADKGDTLKHSSGSLIVIPASAFVDKEGSPVSGKVEIRYREFEDATDMFIAGIPQPQQPTVVQSAAMMQIHGFKNGEPVFIGKDKELKMEQKSTVSIGINLENLNAFAYTEINASWREAAKVEVEILNESSLENPSDSILNSDIKLAEKDKKSFLAELDKKFPSLAKPIEPQKGTPKGMTALGLDFKSKDFPEFAQYENLEWVAYKNIVDPLPENGWSDMKVIRLTDMKYEIVMIPNEESKNKGRKEVRFEAFPLIPYTQKNKKDYEKALTVFNYENKLRAAKIQEEIALWERSSGRFAAIAQINNKKDRDSYRNIVCRFDIKQFGIWNAGNSFKLEQIAKSLVEFTNSAGESVKIEKVYVADGQKQLYYSANAGDALHFDAENMQLWVMDNKGRMMNSSSTPKKEGDKLRFTLQPVDIRSIEDIRNILTI